MFKRLEMPAPSIALFKNESISEDASGLSVIGRSQNLPKKMSALLSCP